MEAVPLATILTIVGLVSAISGIVLGWTGKARTIRQEVASDASHDARIAEKVDYIKNGVDEVRLEQKDQGRRFDSLSERVTRVEESAKQAHKRLDRMDGDQ